EHKGSVGRPLSGEMKILDDNHIMYAKLGDDQYHGSAYGIKGAHRGYLRPACQWNTQQVTVDGDRVTVVLNGYTILETQLKIDAPEGNPAKADTFTKGHFGFTGHFDQVKFRNLRIKELGDPAEKAAE
ncbi:MAG: family 16 glycoside hydrolase, partial [Phycisphaeraceae bacterium]